MTGAIGGAPAGKVLPPEMFDHIVPRKMKFAGKERFPEFLDRFRERKLFRDMKGVTPTSRTRHFYGGETVRPAAQLLETVPFLA